MDKSDQPKKWTARLAGIAARLPTRAKLTAAIIMLVPHQGTAAWMMMSRIAEVGWGVAVGVMTVWTINKLGRSGFAGQEPSS